MAADASQPRPLISRRARALAGRVTVPGDKSISHRALMLGASAIGTTRIDGLLEGADVIGTAEALRALGAGIRRLDGGRWEVDGVGVGGFAEPADILDLGNSGTSARLLLGFLATQPITAFVTGDVSLRRRPMARVTTPLQEFGAQFVSRSGGRLPLAVIGAVEPVPVTYRLPVASAQVKSAVLFAGLNTAGDTTVIEPVPTRDHSELMLRHFGALIETATDEAGARTVTLTGQPELAARDVTVPADPSSAAFLIVGALITPGSEITLPGVLMNPHRIGLIETLIEMGADLQLETRRDQSGEPVADIVARHSALKGVKVPAERAASMIDEYPVLSIAAAFADGPTDMAGLAELRVKESDRLAMIAQGLDRSGVAVEAGEEHLVVHGTGRPPAGGATIATDHDHRIAMSFLIMGLASGAPVAIDDATAIGTSFPDFVGLMNGLGADIAEKGSGDA